MGFPMIAMAGATALQAAGQISQAHAQSAAAGYNAKVAAENAQIAQQNASLAGAEGESNVATEGMKTKAEAGGILAHQGASGVDVNSPSSTDVRTSQAEIGKLNAMQIRSNAARQAYGEQTKAASELAQAKLDRMEQSYDRTAGYVNAAGTVMGGVSKAAMFSNWLGQGDPTANITGIAPAGAGGVQDIVSAYGY